jgi:hypothetical protein
VRQINPPQKKGFNGSRFELNKTCSARRAYRLAEAESAMFPKFVIPALKRPVQEFQTDETDLPSLLRPHQLNKPTFKWAIQPP